ncbi:MAG: M23 family metallopeptidase [bacterium]
MLCAVLHGLASSAHARLPTHNPVPGGVAVVALQAAAPVAAQFGDRRVMLARERGRWHAIVGLSARAAPGEYIVRVIAAAETDDLVGADEASASETGANKISANEQETSQPFLVIARSAAHARRSIQLPDDLAALPLTPEFPADARGLNAELWRAQTDGATQTVGNDANDQRDENEPRNARGRRDENDDAVKTGNATHADDATQTHDATYANDATQTNIATQMNSAVPEFRFQPVAEARRMIPYGLLINDLLPQRYAEHPGITYLTAAGAPAHAPAGGIVHRIERSETAGVVIYLHHGHGMASVLSHLGSNDLQVGERVEAGDPIGVAAPLPPIASNDESPRGRTTLTKSPHGRVHWALLLNGNRIDPMQFSAAR